MGTDSFGNNNNWSNAGIGTGAEIICGQHILAEECTDEPTEFPYLTGPSDFPEGRIVVSKYVRTPKVSCKEKDILLTVKGSGVGKLAVADKTYCISRQLVALRPKSWEPDFLFQCLTQVASRFNHQSTGTIPGITKDDISDWVVPLPPREEQRKIAKILSCWDEGIEATTRIVNRLKFKLGASRERIFGHNGTLASLKTSPCADYFNITIGGTPSRNVPEFWDPKKVGSNIWLSIRNLNSKFLADSSEYISDLGVKKSNVKLLPAGTVVMSFKLSIGRAGILKVDAFTNEAICGFIPKPTVSVDTEYLYQHLMSMDFKDAGEQAVKGKVLNKEKLCELPLKIPDLNMQTTIGVALGALDTEIFLFQRLHERLCEQKQALMQKLLTGKIRVKV